MLFVVLFTDRPDQAAWRATYLQAHIDWVGAHQAQVRVAGSLREQLGQVPTGGLWIVESEFKESVHQLKQTDPFWICGLRQSVEVLHWSKALDQQVLV
ncbi:YciI family protein [Limnohabitans sp. DM1]|uniref:YciI family protein n=1 Tax=Limnohabitans sp. DM1 TaxID=1597955 RepID=UPI000AEE32E0|nr:YciI family protein [Limnohabitans sp. DM1]